MRYLLTQSLLSAWLYQYEAYDPDDAHAEFMSTLMREPVQPTKAMLDGQKFENMVTAYCNGAALDPGHEWARSIAEVSKIVKGGQAQVALYRDYEVSGVHFLIYGRLDWLKAGTIYDTKYSKTYEVGKYDESPQHPMYFALCPEARRFEYIVSDGNDVYIEPYYRDSAPPIDWHISDFLRYLKDAKLDQIYFDKWKARD